jgi:hypothetical protein
MKVWVQRSLTQEYACGDGTWDRDPRLARDFETAARGAEFCQDMEHVQIIVRFSDGRPMLVLPTGKPEVTVRAQKQQSVGSRPNRGAK